MENPKTHGKSYNKWLGDQAKPSHREQLRVMIDRALEQKPADFDALLKLLTEMGCEVSRRGKAIRLKAPGWKNVARMDDKLGAGYSEAEIRAVLAGENSIRPVRNPSCSRSRPRSICSPPPPPPRPPPPPPCGLPGKLVTPKEIPRGTRRRNPTPSGGEKRL